MLESIATAELGNMDFDILILSKTWSLIDIFILDRTQIRTSYTLTKTRGQVFICALKENEKKISNFNFITFKSRLFSIIVHL